MRSRTAKNSSKMIKNKAEEDVNDSCRACMSRNGNMKQIFDGECSTITDRVQYCTGVLFTKEDGLSTKICQPCLYNLTIAYKFKSTCITTDKLLRQLNTKSSVKSEDPERIVHEFDDHFNEQIHDDEDEDKTVVKAEIVEELEVEYEKHVKREGDRNTALELPEVTIVRVSRKRKLNKENKKKSIAQSTKSKSQATIKKPVPYKKGIKQNMIQPDQKTGFPKRILHKLLCIRCNIKFATKVEARRHSRKEHSEKDFSWFCEVCGKVFTSRSSSYSHMQSHLPPRFSCEHCDYATGNKQDLEKHVRVHTGKKTFHCEICPKAFSNSSNLWKHKRFHQGKPDPEYPCKMCDRRFYDRSKLQRHVDSHNDIKRYECEVCHSCFARRSYWKKHLLRQHGVVVPVQRPGRKKINLVIGQLGDVGNEAEEFATAEDQRPMNEQEEG